MAHKLLLADDSITIQKVVELVLADEGFEIKTVNNGEEALSVLPIFLPDIVLADIEMPKVNGYQLCDKIKKNPDSMHIPVILLAGAFEPIDEELAKNVGAEDFIIKPFESQELISKLNATLATGEMEKEAPLEAETLAETTETPATSEEDLWTMEEAFFETEPAAVAEQETPIEEIIGEEPIEIAEAVEAEIEAEQVVPLETVSERVIGRPSPGAAAPLVMQLSKQEAEAIFRQAVVEKITSVISAVDIRQMLVESLLPSIKDTTEKILWEVTPDLVQKLAGEMIQGSLDPLAKQIEKVIWETVPDLAERIISKEIERIKSNV